MVSKDIEEDILYRSVGLKAWWSRGPGRTSVGTFVEGCVLGVIVMMAFMGLALFGLLLGGSAVLLWKLWPLI